MNINQDPLKRPDAQRTPSAAERASMEVTRRHVQQANNEGRRVVAESAERVKAQSRSREDSIEISLRSRRAEQADEAKSDHQLRIEQFRKEHKAGTLASPERVRRAAESMLQRSDKR